jgi:hypothetical protein
LLEHGYFLAGNLSWEVRLKRTRLALAIEWRERWRATGGKARTSFLYRGLFPRKVRSLGYNPVDCMSDAVMRMLPAGLSRNSLSAVIWASILSKCGPMP